MGRSLLLVLSLLLGFTVPADAHELKVVTSFSILGDMVSQIGGDQVSVISLVKADGDMHSYEPSPQDVKILASADLVIINGLGFEPWMDRLIASAGFKGKLVVASQGVAPLETGHEDHADAHSHEGDQHEEDHHHADADPHAWQSLANGGIYAANIQTALIAADPAHAALFEQRGNAYRKRLNALDQWVRRELAPIASDKRKLITSHNSFAYFAAAYGVTFLPASGVSGQGEPSAKALARLVAQMRRENIRTLFLENMSSPQIMNALARETGAKLGGKLYADALSTADGPAPSYEAMFRHNVTQIAAALRAE